MTRDCESCGKPYEVKHPRARFCSTRCRKAAYRARGAGIVELRPVPVATPTGGMVEAATRRDLEGAGRLDSTLGAKCLALAARIDLGADTGSALAALVKQHDATMAEAMKGASRERTVLDELRARRDAKLSG